MLIKETMHKNYLLIILLFLTVLSGFCQEKGAKNNVKTAQKSYYLGDYDKAVAQFKEILKVDAGHYISNFELGRIYLEYYNHYDSAAIYLKNAIDNVPLDTIYETYLDYANALHRSNKYEEAITFYTFFKEKGLAKNSFAELLKGTIDRKIRQCEYAIAQNQEAKEKSVLIKNMGEKTNTERS